MKFIFIAMVFCFFSCAIEEDEGLGEYPNHVEYVNRPDYEGFQDRVVYNGEMIEIESLTSDERTYDIQKIEKSRQDLTYRAKKVPNEVFLRNQGLKDQELEAALKETEGELLFYFEFEEQDKQDLMKKYFDESMDESVSYMAFDISNDFYLIDKNKDTVHADYSVYERSYHLAPFEKLIIGFTNVDETKEMKLVYNDILFGKGQMSFLFAPSEFIKDKLPS